ncbi:MAG: PAS domain S-box protein [Candidatus Acidiferrales bacterium]|jgi:PAS domain S-box-containing protein
MAATGHSSRQREKAEDMRLMVDTIPGLVWSTRPDGSAEFFNQRWLEYTGFSAEQALDWGWKVAIHPDDLPRILETFNEALSLGRSFEVEGRFRRWDGEFRWFLFRGNPLLDGSGKVVKWYGTNTDLEERKRAEDALRDSEQSFRLIVDGIAGLVAIMTSTGEVEGVNRQASEYFGKSIEQLKGWSTSEAVHPDDLPGVTAAWRHSFETVTPYDVEHRLRRADGAYRWFRARGLPLLDAAGQIVRWYVLLTDIDERKRSSEALQHSEERYRSVLETATDSVVSVDQTGQIIFANPATTKTFGYYIPEMIGQPLTMLMPEYMRKLHKAGFQRYQKTNRRHFDWQGVQLIGLRKNGEEFPVEVSFGEGLKNGRHVFTGFIRDITERKQAEGKIREQEVELRQVLELAPQHITVLGPDGSRLYLNPAGLSYYGLTLEEWRGCDPRRLFHHDDRERMTSEGQIKFLSDSPYEVEARLLRNDGKYRWFLFRRNPLRDGQGHITRWYSSATDIEDRKQAEQRLQHENVALREEIDKVSMFEEIVGTSPALQVVLSRVSKVAPTDSTVLITGETGTGKELVARAIHRRSPRSQRAFVSVNCAALAPSLVSSELFGHEKGAFTGAMQRRLGRFELANSGTIFLDEIGELPADTQVALLRVLQEREFERVGGKEPIRVDVRVIAATNRNLETAMANGIFRSDLFYRLSVFPIEVPPLRERKEDVVTLLEYFVERFARKIGKRFGKIDKRTLELLEFYDWPGNIRELQNVVERSVIVSSDDVFCVDEAWLSRSTSQVPAREPESQSPDEDLSRERQIIEAALAECRGRISGPDGAAAKLRIPPSTLDSKIKRLQISKSHFKLG